MTTCHNIAHKNKNNYLNELINNEGSPIPGNDKNRPSKQKIVQLLIQKLPKIHYKNCPTLYI